MNDYKVDMVVRERMRRKTVDRLNDVSPEEASFILNTKYVGSKGLSRSKVIKAYLEDNVDEFINFYKNIIGVKKKK